ncbi:MAG: carbamoyltransferase [Pseudohongiellaceae bacterium]|jgi:carbamoyltransferase
MYILGLSFYYHDGSAALIKDGVVIAAGEEERFTRRKHDSSFPERAIQFCLDFEGITIEDVEYVVFYEKPFIKFERLLITAFQTFPKSLRVFRESMLAWMQKKLWVKSMMLDKLGIPKSKMLFADHHMSHAAASFYTSPFDEAAVLTLDGAGEWTTATMGHGKGTRLNVIKEMRFPHSVGLLYSSFTAYCGFEVNEGEYKLMGMAPYGEPKYVDRIMKTIKIGDDGSLWQDMKYFAYHHSAVKSFTPALEEVMGQPARDPALEDKSLDPFYCDVARSIQAVTEEIVKKMVDHLVEITGCTNVCMAGGVALNSVSNGKLTKETKAKQLYVHSAPGDDGASVGAALWAYHHLLDKPRVGALDHAYLGSEYSPAQVEQFLNDNNIAFEHIKDDETFFDRVSDDLIAGKVGGWFRGRFEWGPRALGARSIIADASNAEMKEIVNAKIKFREAFRPFAPSVLSEDAAEWFELADGDEAWPARFMLYVVPVKEDKREKIPAITHVDGSGRLQTVIKETNPAYHRIIEKFKEKTGIPVILNTSFNLKGEPIVETPAQAFNTFSRSEMDVLYLGNYIVVKEAKKIIDSTPFMLRHEGDRVAEMVS